MIQRVAVLTRPTGIADNIPRRMKENKMIKVLMAVLICGVAAGAFGDKPKVEYLSDSLSDRICTVSQGWGNLGFDTAAKSGDRPGLRLRIKDKEYAHGLGHHAAGEIVVELGGQFKTFEAEVGVQWQGGKNIGSVIFQIYADDKKVFDSGVIRENDPPRPVTASVQGAKELRLVANDAGNKIEHDYADWADARLTRDPAAARKKFPSQGSIWLPSARFSPGTRKPRRERKPVGWRNSPPRISRPTKRFSRPQTGLIWFPWRTARVASGCNGTRTGRFAAPSSNSRTPQPHHCAWDASKPILLRIRSTVPQPYKAGRTVLRFRLPDAAFGVAIEDLLAHDCVYVPHAGVFVTRMPAPATLAGYLKKIAGRKTVLEQVQQRPDQDFPRAWAAIRSPNQDLGPTMISLANDNRKFIVRREGAVLFNEYDRPDDPQGARPLSIFDAFRTQWRCVPSFGSDKNLKFTRHLQDGWLPIPVTTVTDGGVVYRQTTYVAPMSDAPAGSPFWYRDRALCAAEYQIENGGNEAADAGLALEFAGGKDDSFQLQDIREGVLVVRGDRVLALIDTRTAAPLAVKREAQGLVLSGKLPSGAAARCFAFFPAWVVAPKDYAVLLESAGAVRQVESYWRTLLEPAMHVEIPDEFLTNIIRASQVNCMLAARNEDHGERGFPPGPARTATDRWKANPTRLSGGWV